MKFRIMLALLAGTWSVRALAQPATDAAVLLAAYTRFALAQEVQAQALDLAKPLPETESRQVAEQAQVWMKAESDLMRRNLETRFGTEARDRFSGFVAEYTAAGEKNDLHYLGRLAGEAKLGTTPMAFPEMRRLVLEKWLAEPFAKGSRLLGEMQTWAEVRARNPQAPALAAWLARDQAAVPLPAAPSRPLNPLAAAEAEVPEYVPPAGAAPANPMDAFSQSRIEKRDRALQDAQAGMQQMAAERQAAEEEYAAKKMAAAQADAEAMRAQAQKLAAVEQEAIDQRANSWMGRLKNIVSATVGAATGAFTGGIGAEAGRQAADALFPR